MDKIHDPIFQHMQQLPCQHSDTVLWWTGKSFRRCRTKKNDVQKIQPFVLKSGNSINDKPNNNGPNAKLKALYNVVKSAWIMKYGAEKFSPHPMNYVLVEAWHAFNMSAVNIIRDSFVKKKLPPRRPHRLTTNNQACAASIQVSSRTKAE